MFSIDAAASSLGTRLDLRLNERAYVVSVVATILVPLTFITSFFRHELRVDGRSGRQRERLLLLAFGMPIATGVLAGIVGHQRSRRGRSS